MSYIIIELDILCVYNMIININYEKHYFLMTFC